MKSISKKVINWFLIVAGLGLIGSFCIWGFSDKTYTKKDLIENYKLKQSELAELKKYLKTIVPQDHAVDIEFEGNTSLAIFHVTTYGLPEKEKYDTNWSLSVNSEKTAQLLNKLGWTTETLKILKRKLNQANCISINSEEPVTIGYQRSGMGKYFYKLFDRPLSESKKKEYNDGCQYIYFQDNVVLEYGGGAIGPQCFPEERKK